VHLRIIGFPIFATVLNSQFYSYAKVEKITLNAVYKSIYKCLLRAWAFMTTGNLLYQNFPVPKDPPCQLAMHSGQWFMRR